MEICPEHQETILEGIRHIRVPTTIQNNEDCHDPHLKTNLTVTEDPADLEGEEWQEHLAHYHHSPT